ncbi:MAG: PQQ-binding-like beta-propeller repeat protein [Planctomycetes bacterium]|nr:PQQ-binding-like beta-propeller repeat protein [Planctomycetota bacterium]
MKRNFSNVTGFMRVGCIMRRLLLVCLLWQVASASGGENWEQFKYDSRHSGNLPGRRITTPLDLLAAVPLTDAVFTSPVVRGDRIYVVDGSGVATCIDGRTFRPVWRYKTRGGKANCNNVSSPVIMGDYVHFGTMAGSYYVLDAAKGSLVKEIRCGDPIFSTPVAGTQHVYFATLGSRIYCLEPDGTLCWTWDFAKEILGFEGDRWGGEDWLNQRGRATWQSQFCCSRNLALHGNILVVPAGGMVIWLEDLGDKAALRGKHLGGPRESPSTLALSIDESGRVYRQWTRRDNGGRVDILRLGDEKVETDYVRGTETSYKGANLMSFSSVSIRRNDVYRTRPQEGFGLCRHRRGQSTRYLGGYPSIAPPILLHDSAVYGGLDGGLYIVPLSGNGEAWSFKTPFGKAISAPAAVCDGRVYFGCEDGYLYVLGSKRKSSAGPKANDLELWKIRSPLSGKLTEPKYNWFTSFGNFSNTNQNDQGVKPPFKMNWIRRYEGTVKHFSVCGGGRMYTHTAEGQIFAVEQETGRLLWRRYFPGVHVSFTSPLYHEGRLYLPQAGLKSCFLRCFDAATGELLWEAPFTGSPSWNRQQPPIIHNDLVIYLFSTGRYTPEKWLFEHQSTFSFPKDHKPLVRAWDRKTGKEVWTRDFSNYGSGGDDAGLCLMDGRLYYSCYFGSNEPKGLTAAMNPATGELFWTTTQYAVHAGCTISGKDGRLYMGGYNPVEGKINRIWCLDARDGSLVWKSDPVLGAIHVITIGQQYLFTHAQYRQGYLIDKNSGNIVGEMAKGYRCTRFTLSAPYLFAANMNIHEFSKEGKLVYAGPSIDVLQCVGGFVSNGRVFYTTNGGGLQASVLCGAEAELFTVPWKRAKFSN